jgi:preprotein translocase subunit SecG
MSPIEWILLTFQVMSSLFLVAVVLLQSGKRSGLSGAVAGVADTFLSKNQARTWDARLAKLTKWVAALFVILTLTLNLI